MVGNYHKITLTCYTKISYKADKIHRTLFVLNSDQEKYQILNMCNLCRYALFLQAQSHINLHSIFHHQVPMILKYIQL